MKFLPENTNITILSTGKKGSVGEIYKFGPSGISFLSPSTISMIYDPALLPDGVVEDNLFLVTETKDGYLEPLTGVTIDKVLHKVNCNGTLL